MQSAGISSLNNNLQPKNEYQLVAVTEGDVQVVQKINCIYQQSDEEELSFEINGKKIEKVYVEEGDEVKNYADY